LYSFGEGLEHGQHTMRENRYSPVGLYKT